ncbi:DNA-3-methyladenine glycosylase I [Aurantivibrio infirmus]
MRKFKAIYADAVIKKVGEAGVEDNLPTAKSDKELAVIKDDRYLSTMSRRVFRAGLKHSMVDNKWPAFEKVFFGFDPYKVSMMSDEALEKLMQDKSIIRHFGKIKSVRKNAVMVVDKMKAYRSFANFISDWPSSNIVGLWKQLKAEGSQLGGNSGSYFLRMIGKDTFVLTDDVVKMLIMEEVVDKKPTSQRDLNKVQDAFNRWVDESGRRYCEISRILSYAAG